MRRLRTAIGRLTRGLCAVFAISASITCDRGAQPAYLDLATTTSVQNSGLLDTVLPAFTDETGVKIRVHAAGSGRALEMLSDGIIDLAITHAPAAEARYLSAHAGWSYQKVAYNRFVVVGPPGDPAMVRDAADAVDAFRRIARTPIRFVSRGDQSGTHERELALWDAAGVTPESDRLVVSGRGMAMALRHADEVVGYTLSDEATFWQLQPSLDLTILFDADPRLLNSYAVVYPGGEERAGVLAKWLTEGAGRGLVGAYQASGRAVFTVWPMTCPANTPDALPCQ